MSKHNRERRQWHSVRGAEAPPGVRWFVTFKYGSLDPVLDHELKIMVFTSSSECEAFVEAELTPSDVERAELERLGFACDPIIVVMSENKWQLFQKEQAGRFNEYHSAAAAKDALYRKRQRFLGSGQACN
jgi:hypothetical protein